MTIEQAIEHAEDTAISAIGCECREEHKQLAEWLRELVERRKAPEIVRCGECKHKRDLHYEEPGEEPYIKSICKNKYGLTEKYQVHDWDFCSRAERRTE